jgi:hypothetical protein
MKEAFDDIAILICGGLVDVIEVLLGELAD